MMTLNRIPVVRAEMLVRKPVDEVYEAFIDPAITTNFWFTKSSGRLETGQHVTWEWEMYGVSDRVFVLELEENKRIRVQSSDNTITEWHFTPRSDQSTFVSITHSGYTGDGEDIINHAMDAMGGYTMVLCGLKAWLEHQIRLNLVADKAPDAHVN